MLALACTVLVWLSFQWLPEHASADAQAAFFLAWSLPLAAWLGMRLFARACAAAPIGAPPQARDAGAQEIDRQLLGQAREHLLSRPR